MLTLYRLAILAILCGEIATQCPDGWTAYSGSCYLFSHENVDFNEAESFCEHHEAHLVHIEDSFENKFLKSLLRDLKVAHHWLGLTDRAVEGVWRWDDTNDLANFTDFHPSQPNNGRNSNCAIFWVDADFAWADEPCTNRKYQPLCEKHSSNIQCPDGWVVFSDSCYLFSHENVHFTEAENFCRQHGSHLVHVETSSENAFVKSVLRDVKVANHWLGMTDQVIEDIWKWYDTNTVVTFTDWNPGQPNQGRAADCAVFWDDFDFKWADEPCSAPNYQPICEMKHEMDIIVG